MTSPLCTVSDNGGPAGPTINGVDVANDGTDVTIALADIGGVGPWSLAFVQSDDMVVVPALTVDYVHKTATFTKPTGPWALILQSQVNLGLDVNFQKDNSLTTTFGIYIRYNGLRLAAANERTEGSSEWGWTTKFNDLVRSSGGIPSGAYHVQRASGGAAVVTVIGSQQPQYAGFHNLSADGTCNLPTTGMVDGQPVQVQSEFAALSAGHNIVIDGGTNHIYYEETDQGTSYTMTLGAWGAGGGAIAVWNGSYWVLS